MLKGGARRPTERTIDTQSADAALIQKRGCRNQITRFMADGNPYLVVLRQSCPSPDQNASLVQFGAHRAHPNESDLSPFTAEYQPKRTCSTQNKAKRANKKVFLLLTRDQAVGVSWGLFRALRRRRSRARQTRWAGTGWIQARRSHSDPNAVQKVSANNLRAHSQLTFGSLPAHGRSRLGPLCKPLFDGNNFLYGTMGLVNGGVGVGVTVRVRIGDSDLAEWFAAENAGAF